MSTHLHIPVEPTIPPSQAVRVLGQTVHLGPADVDADREVLVCIDPSSPTGLRAVSGCPTKYGCPARPVTPEGASPLAYVRLLRCQVQVGHEDIEIAEENRP